MLLTRCVPTATTWTIVFYLDCIFGLSESSAYLFSSKDISIKILAKYLGSLIIDFILRVYHYAIFGASLVKNISYKFRMTRIDKH